MFTLEQATKAQRGVEVWLYSFFNLGTKWGWVVNAVPLPLYPRAGLDGCGKSHPPPGFDPWTFQPVASHCTN
jgi:hypothetical protein